MSGLRFRFELRPVAAVRPWGDEAPRWGWFILTDGWYWIEVGGHELLRYAEAEAEASAEAGADGGGAAVPYVDYYVVRLWEDLVDALPRLLEPVPPDLFELAAGGGTGSAEATSWAEGHTLDMGHLRDAPDLRFRRTVTADADTMTITWTHSTDEDSIAFTAPPTGRVTIPTEDFVAAVTAFDRDLFTAMESRVTTLEASGPPEGITLDLPALRHEQQDRQTWLPRALARSTETA
ncbi:DUF5984 family protein [Embleya sp. AB8]|uniref:DUF5984 family protein n=1 Tax=Embleya sp. AB8 TaxID=3156304 RepID=UPI003C719EA1